MRYTKLGRTGLDEYVSWVAPERKLIAYLNLTRGHAVRVANFARPMTIEATNPAMTAIRRPN